MREIDKQFPKALAAADALKKTPDRRVRRPAGKGQLRRTPTGRRCTTSWPTTRWSSTRRANRPAARAEDAFDLPADSPIFATAEDFVAWKPETTDEDSPTLKAIRLYQDLIRFHQPDDDRSALLDADLLRLEFGNNKAFGEEKTARYKAALKRFADKFADHEISARALLRSGRRSVHGEGDWVEARQIASKGWPAFPTASAAAAATT